MSGNDVSRLWARLPIGRVVRLGGASAEAVALSADPLPPDAPAIISYPAAAAASPAEFVSGVLGAMEHVAVRIFPAWLPEAAGITTAAGAGVPAVRALALRHAGTAGHFGPFLADLAEHALRRCDGGDDRFPAGVRAAGLARALAAGYGRAHTALLVRVPERLTPAGEHVTVAGCEWLAQHGPFGVWLTGAPLRTVDRVQEIAFDLPADLADLDRLDSGTPDDAGTPDAAPVVGYPALAGLPNPASRAEQALESALAACPWAAGREWNRELHSHVLVNPVRVDLLWRAERCVVEVDGPDHRGALKYDSDRRRDVRLQLDGYAVLRFTNDQIAEDPAAVLVQLERFLEGRRRA